MPSFETWTMAGLLLVLLIHSASVFTQMAEIQVNGTIKKKAGTSVILPCKYKHLNVTNPDIEWIFRNQTLENTVILSLSGDMAFHPKSEWIKQVSFSSDNGTKEDASLLVNSLRSFDNGSYTCKVKQGYNLTLCFYILIVEEGFENTSTAINDRNTKYTARGRRMLTAALALIFIILSLLLITRMCYSKFFHPKKIYLEPVYMNEAPEFEGIHVRNMVYDSSIPLNINESQPNIESAYQEIPQCTTEGLARNKRRSLDTVYVTLGSVYIN
ncbi:uncharacterized protein LOC122809503 [Protopterus annectens]|uniref:uncharacterized protein LOC122809503 n=1 Tax=Protopterus annectens TaxID=7888 RepID=UPI001CFB3CC7|nr:uncharacterized protein LOC122809503 [Protopterus annectens]